MNLLRYIHIHVQNTEERVSDDIFWRNLFHQDIGMNLKIELIPLEMRSSLLIKVLAGTIMYDPS